MWQEEDKMAANYARLPFVHRMVSNLYGEQHNHNAARKVLERFGGTSFLKEIGDTIPEHDTDARNELADLLYVWWITAGDTRARDRAQEIWTSLLEGDKKTHAAIMLGFIALQKWSASDRELHIRISQLRAASTQTTDVESANLLKALTQQLTNIALRRCENDK
jgi:hypothetical protein